MAKSSRPDRKRTDRKSREPKEFEETTLSVDRVTRVVAGGRRMRFRAVVVIGNKKGKVGLGTGKANDVQTAVRKADLIELIILPHNSIGIYGCPYLSRCRLVDEKLRHFFSKTPGHFM